MERQLRRPWRWSHVMVAGLVVLGILLLAGCVAPIATQNAPASSEEAALPTLTPLALAGRALRVVATTNLVGDVVARIGGDNIELTTLLAPGVDPHAYQLAPADRQQLEDADVIVINGLGLEEGMLPVLDDLAGQVAIVPVSAGIETIEFVGEEDEHTDEGHADEEHADEEHADDEHTAEGAHAESEEHHHHEGADPHTWQSVPNVMVWTENIATALAALDPEHAADYTAAADDYRTELTALDAELHALAETVPAEQRKLVTDHDSLGYFAHEYGFTVIGTVIPSLSTVAAASAQQLAALQEQITHEGVKAIFVGTTVNTQLATQLATDLGIQVVPIYTDSLSDTDGPASTYVDFMRYNMQTIVAALTAP